MEAGEACSSPRSARRASAADVRLPSRVAGRGSLARTHGNLNQVGTTRREMRVAQRARSLLPRLDVCARRLWLVRRFGHDDYDYDYDYGYDYDYARYPWVRASSAATSPHATLTLH